MKMLKCAVTVTAVSLAAVLCSNELSAQTPLPIYEPFPTSYTNGAADETVAVPATNTTTYPTRRLRNGTTATLWSIGGSPGGGSTLVAGPAGLSYPGLYHDPVVPSIGVYVRTNLTTANRTAGILFPTISSGSIYASFLLNVLQLPTTTNRCLVKFETATSGTGSTGGNGAMAGVFLTASGELGLSKSATTVVGVTNATVLTAGTHLVVARYTFNGGADDDEIALWLDPGALGAPTEPPPSLTWTTGADVPSISSFYIQAPQNGPPQVPASFYFDELRLSTTWSEVTSTQAFCVAAGIFAAPTNQTVSEGISGSFTVVASGSTPTFQWQVSTNNGVSWNNVTAGVGGTSQTYLTPPATPADNGYQYRAIATVACNSSSAISSAATLSVMAAVKATNGVIVDDVFQDFVHNNLPYDQSNSVWFASTASTLDASSGQYMLATSQAGSVAWLGFFTDDQNGTNLPVHLDIGKALKATLVFKANNIVSNAGNFRIGLFDYADGGTRPLADGAAVANSGVNVRGYMATLNFGTNFTANPFSLFARNNLVADLMGTTGNYLGLGGGPTGYAGTAAFQNGVTYTAEFTVARKAVSSVDFSVNISGGGTNWTFTSTDTSYAYPRFDAIGIRSGGAAVAADTFEISRLLVEVVTAAPSPIPLSVTRSGSDVVLSWTDSAFTLQAAPEVSGTYTNVPGATSPHTNATSGTGGFFRLHWP